MIKVLITTLMLIAMLMTSCTELEKANFENTEVVIDGKQYKIKLEEVITSDNKTMPKVEEPIKINKSSQSIEEGYDLPPNDSKYYITMLNGEVYATRDEVIYVTGDIIRLSNYYVRNKEGERWFYHSEPIELSREKALIEQMRR